MLYLSTDLLPFGHPLEIGLHLHLILSLAFLAFPSLSWTLFSLGFRLAHSPTLFDHGLSLNLRYGFTFR